MHRDLCSRLSKALPILPKMDSLDVSLQSTSANEPEVSVQSSIATAAEVSLQTSSATEVSLPPLGDRSLQTSTASVISASSAVTNTSPAITVRYYILLLLLL